MNEDDSKRPKAVSISRKALKKDFSDASNPLPSGDSKESAPKKEVLLGRRDAIQNLLPLAASSITEKLRKISLGLGKISKK